MTDNVTQLPHPFRRKLEELRRPLIQADRDPSHPHQRVVDVYKSCTTIYQLAGAQRYALLWAKRNNIPRPYSAVFHVIEDTQLKRILRSGSFLGFFALLLLAGCGEKEQSQVRFLKRSASARVYCLSGTQAYRDGCYVGYMRGCSAQACPAIVDELD